jgi:hypothetical protein
MLRVKGFVSELRTYAETQLKVVGQAEVDILKEKEALAFRLEVLTLNLTEAKTEANQAGKMADVIEGAFS